MDVDQQTKTKKDKTELLYLFSKYNPQQSLPPLRFGTDIIKPSSHAKNIGAIFDTTMSMLPHINNVCKSAFYHLRTISRIRKYLSTQTTETLIHAFVTSKLDHCNSLLYNVPKHVIKKLQSVQNAAARLLLYSHPLRSSHPLFFFIFFFIFLILFKHIYTNKLLLQVHKLHFLLYINNG